jgi:hypothetical protein
MRSRGSVPIAASMSAYRVMCSGSIFFVTRFPFQYFYYCGNIERCQERAGRHGGFSTTSPFPVTGITLPPFFTLSRLRLWTTIPSIT